MDLFTLAAKLKLDSSEFESGIKQSEGRFKQFGQKVGSAAKTVAKVGGAAMVAAGAAVGAFMKKALDARGALEQAMGGAEAVFGKYSKSMVAQAKDAYETMGLSQREFLETSNKLGSLLQGSGYKEAEAAKTATKVMQRASDVASIMGIDVADAMTAVTAAAKGNFTMMDNLGVAINATTIESYAQAKGIKKTYNEMTTAEKVGLAYQLFLEKTAKYAGNYAKENETYAGSINTLKKAWENFMSGSGDAKAVVTSLGRVIKVIGTNIAELAPALAKGLGDMVKTAFKSIKWPSWHDVKIYAKRAWEGIQQGINGLGGLIFGTNKKGQVKWPTWKDVKKAAESAWKTIKSEAQMAAARILSRFVPITVTTNSETGESIINWPSWDQVRESAEKAWEDIKKKAAELSGLVFGNGQEIVDNIKSVFESASTAIKNIDWTSVGTTIFNLITAPLDAIASLFNTIFTGAKDEAGNIDWSGLGTSILNYIGSAFSAVGDVFKGYFQAAYDKSVAVWEGIGQWFNDNVWTPISTYASAAWETISNFFSDPISILETAWSAVATWFDDNVWTPIKTAVSDAWEAISNFFQTTILGSIQAAWGGVVGFFEPIVKVYNDIKDAATNAFNAVKKILGLDGKTSSTSSTHTHTTINRVVNYETEGKSGTVTNAKGEQVETNNLSQWYLQNHHAKGAWDIPYDNYPALLHRNEMVLTASQARQYREGQNGMNLGALANTIVAAVKEGMKNAQVNAYMDGKEVTDNVSRRMANEFKAMRYAT